VGGLGTGVAGVLYESSEHVKFILVSFSLISESDIARNAVTSPRQRQAILTPRHTSFADL